MEQDVFSFDDEIPTAPKTEPEKPRAYGWEWGDDWPKGLSLRDELLLQVRRDMRAAEEEIYDADQLAFYYARIESYRQLIVTMSQGSPNDP